MIPGALLGMAVALISRRPEWIRRTPVFGMADALGFALGYTPMIFSPLMIHLYLALIMWVTMITSATLSLIILPVLLGKGGKG